MMRIREVKSALGRLGYYAGVLDDDYLDPIFRADLKRFQLDMNLKDDGWYGVKTEAALAPLVHALSVGPGQLRGDGYTARCRRWKITQYYVGDVGSWGPGATDDLVPMRTPAGELLATVRARAFAEAALEGATKLIDGRIVGVANPAYGAADPVVFRPVYEFAMRNGWIPDKPGYAGIALSPDHLRVTGARNFELRRTGPKGWPLERSGIECDPFRTVAADLGVLPRHDPQFMGKGGVVPVGTRVWILELVGKRLPDGTIHDGWCTVNDTGGGIYGAHMDLFTGTRALSQQVRVPSRAHIWFNGIEARIPMSYSYGL